MAKYFTILLFIVVFLLTACSSNLDLSEFEETSDLPGAGEINAAAGRAATNDQSAGDEPTETPSSDLETSTSKATPDQTATEPAPTDPPAAPSQATSTEVTPSEATPSEVTPTVVTNRRVEVGDPFPGVPAGAVRVRDEQRQRGTHEERGRQQHEKGDPPHQ